MKTETYWILTRTLATLGIAIQGLYYSATQPSSMDFFNALVGGVAVYSIWFARERKVEESK